MRLIKLDIVRFGKLSDFSLELSSGMNIIEGKNESGKSTLQAFIRFVLYGFGRRNPNVEIGERERALSWLEGVAKGSLTLEHEGKKYRVEREEKSAGRGSCKIIDLQTGEGVFSGEVPGEVFLGLTSSVFDSLCNIRQLECGSLDGSAVKRAIENIITGADEGQSTEKALKAIDKERQKLLHKKGSGGKISELKEKCEMLENELVSANSNHEKLLELSAEIEDKRLKLKKLRLEYDTVQNMCDLKNGAERLAEFRELSALKKEKEELEARVSELDGSAARGAYLPTEGDSQRAKQIAENLDLNEKRLKDAEHNLDSAKLSQSESFETGFENAEALGELLTEFSTPENLVLHIKTKKKKVLSSGLLFSFFLGLSLALIGGGVALIVIRQLFFGAVTLFALGAAVLFLSVLVLFKRQASSRDLSRVLSMLKIKDLDEIYSLLSKFSSYSENSAKSSDALRSAEIDFGVQKELYEKELNSAKALAKQLSLDADTDAAGALLDFAKKADEYLSARASLTAEATEKDILIKNLASRLERYSETALVRDITPEIEEKLSGYTPERLALERRALEEKLRVSSSSIAQKEREFAEKKSVTKNPEALSRELYIARKELEKEEKRLGAIMLAYETLTLASDNIKSTVTPRICKSTGELMSKMTLGKYSELYISDEMKISLLADGETRPIEALSTGSCDLAYFAARLALISVVCAGKSVPVIMDETFAMLDSEREIEAMRAIKELCESGSQALLFTCRDNDRLIAQSVFEKDELCCIRLNP